MQAKQIEKYAVALVSVWVLFAVTFAIAIFRVSHSNKYGGLHLHSWTLDGKQPAKTTK
ncbi:MAG TPA: hypothetical protein VK203_11710 [Nostocaceae cyanobacterium]|nr:hypothetical protein [Nostocaceae cyanobacterium]